MSRDYIADYYWPQGKSKKEGARVTGEMIQKMYKRMEEKEKAQDGSGQNGTPPVKKESAQPAETKDVKKEIKAETATPAPTVAPADGVKKEEEKEDGEI